MSKLFIRYSAVFLGLSLGLILSFNCFSAETANKVSLTSKLTPNVHCNDELNKNIISSLLRASGNKIKLPPDSDDVCSEEKTGGFGYLKLLTTKDKRTEGTFLSPASPPGSRHGHSGLNNFSVKQPPNLKVDFVLQSMENVIVSGGGFNADLNPDPFSGDPNFYIHWLLHSPTATDELLNPTVVGLPIPFAGQYWPIDHANFLYSGLVLNGCGSTPVFPISIESWIADISDFIQAEVHLAEFNATDNSTIQPNGYWSFSYTMRVADRNGGVSDIKVKGYVSALCSAKDNF